MRGNTLANVTAMLKGEIGYSLTSGVATAQDQELYTIIDNKQKWLSTEWDWPFLVTRSDVSVSTGVGARYNTLPTGLDYERPVKVERLFNSLWEPMEYGIDSEEYNVFSSGDGGVSVNACDPIMRWRLYSNTQFEIWPIPVTAQTVRFTGQRTLTDLKNGGSSYVTSQTLDLDDMMVMLFAAAEKLARMKQGDAQAKLAMAQNRMSFIRASYSTRPRQVRFGLYSDRIERRPIRIVAV